MQHSLLRRIIVGLVTGLFIFGSMSPMVVMTQQAQAHEVANLSVVRQTVWLLVTESGSGSAVVLGPGLAVTAGHVVEGSESVQLIRPADGTEVNAIVVKAELSEANDIAILKPEFGIFPGPYAPVRADIPAQDEVVVSIGFPVPNQVGGTQIATFGNYQDYQKNGSFALITSPTAWGNSGGGTFDAQGRLIGLTIALAGVPGRGVIFHLVAIYRADAILDFINKHWRLTPQTQRR